MWDASECCPDICDRGLCVEIGDCEEGFVPAAVGAWFFIAEDEVFEEFRGVCFLFASVSGCFLLGALFSLPFQLGFVVRAALLDWCSDVDLSSPSISTYQPHLPIYRSIPRSTSFPQPSPHTKADTDIP